MITSDRLGSRIAMFVSKPCENECAEDDYAPREIGAVWAEILPTKGALKEGMGDTSYSDITHKITVRRAAIKKPSNDMFFVFCEQRYNVRYFMPAYRNRDFIEFYCSLECGR